MEGTGGYKLVANEGKTVASLKLQMPWHELIDSKAGHRTNSIGWCALLVALLSMHQCADLVH